MSWSYDETALNDPINQVRLKLGDINTDDQQLQDEEIQLLIDEAGSVEAAVQRGARVLAARYARNVDKWVGDLKILASQRARAYRELAESLTGAASVFRVPSAGGIRVGEKEAMADDTELVQPYFRRDLHDNVGGE